MLTGSWVMRYLTGWPSISPGCHNRSAQFEDLNHTNLFSHVLYMKVKDQTDSGVGF